MVLKDTLSQSRSSSAAKTLNFNLKPERFQNLFVRKIDNSFMCVIVYMIVVCGFLGLLTGSDVRHVTEEQLIRKFPNTHFQKKAVKKILMWKPFLDWDITDVGKGCLGSCQAKCEITDDKNDIENVDAVIFHLSDLWAKNWRIGTRSIIQLPSYRRPDQVWVISNMEPPQHLFGDLVVFNGLFNWTQWYRTDADIQWRYGQPYKLSGREKAKAHSEWSNKNFFKLKTRDICGRISNCMDINRRYKTIKEMQKDLNIDMYGYCYGNPCGDSRSERDHSCNSLMKEYKFYLAFENNDCIDYVTEKYWQSIHREQIPIVNWKSINRSIVIPNSYINVYDFKDLKSLTAYIKKVSENETLYNSYFDWKKSYANWHQCTSCQICEAIHDESRSAQVIDNLDGWVRKDICEKVGYFNDFKKYIQYYTFRVTGL